MCNSSGVFSSVAWATKKMDNTLCIQTQWVPVGVSGQVSSHGLHYTSSQLACYLFWVASCSWVTLFIKMVLFKRKLSFLFLTWRVRGLKWLLLWQCDVWDRHSPSSKPHQGSVQKPSSLSPPIKSPSCNNQIRKQWSVPTTFLETGVQSSVIKKTWLFRREKKIPVLFQQ